MPVEAQSQAVFKLLFVIHGHGQTGAADENDDKKDGSTSMQGTKQAINGIHRQIIKQQITQIPQKSLCTSQR